MPVGSVAGSVYLVPKPVPTFQGYTEIKGVVECPNVIASPVALKATPLPGPVGSVAGLAYLVPKPVLTFHGYAET